MNEADHVDKLLAPLVEGWTTYCEWWRAMAHAGKPLPTGAVCALTPMSLLEHSLLELRREAARALQVELSAVRVRLDTDDAGRPVPILDVAPDAGIRRRVRAATGANLEKLDGVVEAHVAQVTRVVYRQWLRSMKDRIDSCMRVRKDLMPTEVKDLLHG